MQMTKSKPTKPGWYWYMLPGSWALQPILVFDAGPNYGLMYATAMIEEDSTDDERDGNFLAEASENALWSDEPLMTPND